MSEYGDALECIDKLKAQVECLKAENADLRQRLRDLTNITRCKNCRHSVLFKGRLLCARNAKIRPNGDIWGATAKEENNFCMYGQGE